MDLHKSHDTPSAASGLAQTQTACCGASNERAPVILIDGGGADDRSTAELIQCLESGGARVLGVGDSGALNVGSLRDAHTTEMLRRPRLHRSAALQAIAAGLALGAIGSGLSMGAWSRIPAPPKHLTEQDHDRLAAAQAKRDRRAAKRTGAQP